MSRRILRDPLFNNDIDHKDMCRWIKLECRNFLIGATLFLAACANNASISPVADPHQSPVDKRTACEKKFSDRVDQIVTLTGRFSIMGKFGPSIVIDECAFYLRSEQAFEWNDDKYSRMEGKSVRVTGTLRFKRYPAPPPGPVAEARAPSHFYFDPRISRIELNEYPAKP